MEELILKTIEVPTIPNNWDYENSVEKTKTFFYKWKNLTSDILEELWIAREMLSSPGSRTDLTLGQMSQGWDDYCKEIGTERRTVNRWLEKTYSSNKIKEPIQPEFDENIETINNCPSCGYEW